MDAHENGRRSVDGRDLFQGDEVGGRVEPEPVELLGDHHPEEPELAEPPDERGVERRLTVEPLDVRRDLRARELTRHALDLALLLRQGN